MKRVAIVGAGGHARDVLDVFEADNARAPAWEILGFVVETAWYEPGRMVNGYPHLGDLDWVGPHARDVEFIVAVGDTALRRRLAARVSAAGGRFCSVVHPAAITTRRVTIAEGCAVSAGVVMTNNVRLGPHVHVNIGSTLAHDVQVDAYATISPGARLSGNVHVCEGAYVGTGATIVEKLTIGAWSTVGAGAAVIRDVPPDATAVGCPARVVKQRQPGWHLA